MPIVKQERTNAVREKSRGLFSDVPGRITSGILVGLVLTLFGWFQRSQLQHENVALQRQLETEKIEFQMQLEVQKAQLKINDTEVTAESQKQFEIQRAVLDANLESRKASLQTQIDRQKAELEKHLVEQRAKLQKETEEAKAVLESQRDEKIQSADSQRAARERLIAHKMKVGEMIPGLQDGFWRIAFLNKCTKLVTVAIHYQAVDGMWATKGWWEISPGVTKYTELTTSRTFYHFATEETDNPRVWAGSLRTGGIPKEIAFPNQFERLDNDIFIGKVTRTVIFDKQDVTSTTAGTHTVNLTCTAN